MDASIATGVIGSVLGAGATLGATWLNGRFNRKMPYSAEKEAKRLLLGMLKEPDWKWRKIGTLGNVIGVDHATVRRLLLEIGARGAMNNPDYWGLASRNPFSSASKDEAEVEQTIMAEQKSGNQTNKQGQQQKQFYEQQQQQQD